MAWGETDLEIGDEWVRVSDENAVYGDDDNPVCAETIKATGRGVLWSAWPENSSGYFETEELTWRDLDAVAAGINPFKSVGGRSRSRLSGDDA